MSIPTTMLVALVGNSAVFWKAKTGHVYHVLVAGTFAAGTFSLTIQKLLITNDICENAESLDVPTNGTALEVLVPLTTATMDANHMPPEPCYNILRIGLVRGVWYLLPGTEGAVAYTVEVESSNDFGTAPPFVEVYPGVCGSLLCPSNGVNESANGDKVSFNVDPTEDYLVYVFYRTNPATADARLKVRSVDEAESFR